MTAKWKVAHIARRHADCLTWLKPKNMLKRGNAIHPSFPSLITDCTVSKSREGFTEDDGEIIANFSEG